MTPGNPSRVALLFSMICFLLGPGAPQAKAHDADHFGGQASALHEARKAIRQGEDEGANLARSYGWGEDRLCQAESAELGASTDLARETAAAYGYLPGQALYFTFLMSMRRAYGERFDRERKSCQLAVAAASDRETPILPPAEGREVDGVLGGAVRAGED